MTAQDGIHEIEEIAENTWRIDEGGFVNCYLLAGKTGALLIDTGIGAGRLRETVESLTKLPVTVVLTHGHCDHAGGTGWYPSYFIHPADRAFIYRVMSSGLAVKMLMNGVKKQYGKSSAGAASGGQPEAGQQTDMVLPEITKKPYHSKAVSLSGNQCFDLGERFVHAISVPGHTRGSVALEEEKSRLLFTGDDINVSLWMQLPGCTTFREWMPGAERLLFLAKDHEVFCGHGDGRQSAEQMRQTIALVGKMLEAPENYSGRGRLIYPDAETFPQVVYRRKSLKS
jgi:hydroxyacylglutathione hydrolase